jgi:hypothetical protein
MSTRGCGGDCCRAAPKAWRATPGCASHRWGDRRCGGVQVPAALKVQDGHRNIRNVPDVSVHLNLEISAPVYCKLANCCVEIFLLEVGRGGAGRATSSRAAVTVVQGLGSDPHPEARRLLPAPLLCRTYRPSSQGGGANKFTLRAALVTGRGSSTRASPCGMALETSLVLEPDERARIESSSLFCA